MSHFFVITDQSVLGPFTGIELREAALAGVLDPETVVGSSPQGPWYSAIQIGLFSKKKVPLPHPAGTPIPRYHAQGMPGAFQGPFKLRELIGFAARGMLPSDARLRLATPATTPHPTVTPQDWVLARCMRILTVCMAGELVMLDSAGRVHLRTEGVLAGADFSRWGADYRAPLAMMRSVDHTDVTTRARAESLNGTWDESDHSLPRSDVSDVENLSAESDGIRRRRVRLPGPRYLAGQLGKATHGFVQSRFAMTATFLLLVSVATSVGLTLTGSRPMERDELIGQWVARSTRGKGPALGIAFREDGRCTIYNLDSMSWSGDFQWKERQDRWSTHAGSKPISLSVDVREPHHRAGVIEASDGYVVLSGLGRHAPLIDGHEVTDLFVRRNEDRLQIGYLTNVKVEDGRKELIAGWIDAEKSSDIISHDPAAYLKEIEVEENMDLSDGTPDLPDAIAKAEKNLQDEKNREWGFLVRPSRVDAAYLLQTFGVPNEARRIYPYELKQINLSKQSNVKLEQLVRYDDLVLILSADGKVQYVRVDTSRYTSKLGVS